MANLPLDGELMEPNRLKHSRRNRGHPQIVRDRIKANYLVQRLMQHVAGRVELSMSQIRAAEILLRKVVPDLRSVEHTGTVDHRLITDMTDAELIAIAAGRSRGSLETPGGADLPALVHGVHDAELEGVEDSQGDMRAA